MLRNLVVVAGLWGLVNNAGVSLLAELEMTSEESLRQLFEVNFFGAGSIVSSHYVLFDPATPHPAVFRDGFEN